MIYERRNGHNYVDFISKVNGHVCMLAHMNMVRGGGSIFRSLDRINMEHVI